MSKAPIFVTIREKCSTLGGLKRAHLAVLRDNSWLCVQILLLVVFEGPSIVPVIKTGWLHAGK